MLSLWIAMLPVVMVSVIALAMAICSSGLSATQFAIYMSVANLGHAFGSKLYGLSSEGASYAQSYLFLSSLAAVLLFVVLFHRHRGEQQNTPHHTLVVGGAEAGAFWSGKIRCPKCRADMEQVDFDDTEIDRCTTCSGIWFDAGELEIFRDKKAAAAIDTGDAKVGKESNRIDQYPCPRCSGEMVKVVDPQQTHIWYETCSACSGSFLDAGELIDLSKITISDFFKGLLTPERR